MIAGRLDPWEIRDVSEWPEGDTESRGNRSKRWVRDTYGREWLRKLPRQSRPYEPVIESTMLRLARACGIDAPESYVCTWQDDDG